MVEHSRPESDDGFSPEWLTLREPADHAARSRPLTHQLAAWASDKPQLRILEMGTGTGSNLRYLCPHLGRDQHWTLLDNDPVLLARLPTILQQWTFEKGFEFRQTDECITLSGEQFEARIQWRCVDLANELDSLPFDSTHIVTASALLDLTSEAWLRQLAEQCTRHHCASLFVLNYDGHIRWQPSFPEDTLVAGLLNKHQSGDKGFGAAMGPMAGQMYAQLLQPHQQVYSERSNWQIDDHQQELQTALIDGWVEAAVEVDNASEPDIRRWHDRRRQETGNDVSTLTVGHTDILALPLTERSTSV